MSEQTTKEKLREYLEEDACYSDSDFILSYFDEALDIAISSERERIKGIINKHCTGSNNVCANYIKILRELEVKSK
jgi:hypothetical protein